MKRDQQPSQIGKESNREKEIHVQGRYGKDDHSRKKNRLPGLPDILEHEPLKDHHPCCEVGECDDRRGPFADLDNDPDQDRNGGDLEESVPGLGKRSSPNKEKHGKEAYGGGKKPRQTGCPIGKNTQEPGQADHAEEPRRERPTGEIRLPEIQPESS